MFQDTRLRLAIWYTTVTAVLLIFFATMVYGYVRNTLIDRIDDTLKHVVEVVERSLSIQPVGKKYLVNLEASFANHIDIVEDDRIDLEWFSPQGKLLWSTFNQPLTLPVTPNRHSQTIHLSPEKQVRQFTTTVTKGQEILGYLRVSHPWFEVTKPIHQLSLDLVLGLIVTICCVAAIGWWLSGIAIQPVIDSYQKLKQFTADASHELRNPLATIQTNVQIALAYENPEPQWQQQQLKVIERLTRRLGYLVNDLLFLARSDSGMLQTSWQDIPLDGLLIEVIEEQKLIAEQKKIFLSLHLSEAEEDAFTVSGDWEQLARLFTNLIGNALEYIQPSADINRQLAVEIELELVKHPRHPQLQIKVKDNGQGIPESSLSSLFDRFYRLDPSRTHNLNTQTNYHTGTGLGLAIAKAIVEHHQGAISVESKLGCGTIFTVLLPQAK